jgi:hypothetical protein
VKEFLANLRKAAWHTSGARYNAGRRLKRREIFGIISIASFSALTIVVAVVQRVFAIQPGSSLDNLLTAGSIALGVLLIVVSLVEWGSANGAKAEALHSNAEVLNAFQREIELLLLQVADSIEYSKVEALRSRYESTKAACPYNHIPLDYKEFLASLRSAKEHADENGKPTISWARAIWHRALWQFHSVWYFSICWIVVVLSIGFILQVGLQSCAY